MSKNLEIQSFVQARNRQWLSAASGTSIFIGENGKGKSRLLAELERESTERALPTIAIANTPYDRFRSSANGSKRLLARFGSSGPHIALKAAISSAADSKESDIALRRVSRVLRHCGYLPDVGIRVHMRNSVGSLEWDVLNSLDKSEREEIEAIASVLSRGDFPKGIVWFDFDSGRTDVSYRLVIPRVVRWEKELKRLGFLSRVSLYLRKPGELEFSISAASSGELSLISAIAFIAVNIEPNATILIDEPENSLHPRWQREYLELLHEVTKFRGAKVFIATHSPLIVADANQDTGQGFADEPTTIIVLTEEQDDIPVELPESLEGILAEAFRTVTPQNHYLSETLVELMNRVDRDPGSLQSATTMVSRYQAAMPDERQSLMLQKVQELLPKVAAGE